MSSRRDYFTSVLSLLHDEKVVIESATPIEGGYGTPCIDRLVFRKPMRGYRTMIAKFIPEATGRELSAYEYFLKPFDGDRSQPVATVHGEESGWWLFLRDYGNTTLADTNDPAAWISAARRLASFQTFDMSPLPKRLPPRQRFIKYDRAHFKRMLKESSERFERYLAGVPGPESSRFAQVFDAGRRRVEAELRHSPAELETPVHGDWKDANLLAVQEEQGVVIYPVDWANAGFGSPFQDLATLVRDVSDDLREPMLGAYREVWIEKRGAVPDGENFDRSLAVFVALMQLISVGILSLYHAQGLDPERQESMLRSRLRSLENGEKSE